jgi:hypothetical protein
VSREADEQRDIDAKRRAQAQDIVDAVKWDTLEQAKNFAHAWVMTALQASANEAYMHDSRDKALAELAAVRGVLAAVLRDNKQLEQNLTDAQERASSLKVELQDALYRLESLAYR